MQFFLNMTCYFSWFLFLVPIRVPHQNRNVGTTYPMLMGTRKRRTNLLESPGCINRVETKRIKRTSVCGARGLMMTALPKHTEVCLPFPNSVGAIRRFLPIRSSFLFWWGARIGTKNRFPCWCIREREGANLLESPDCTHRVEQKESNKLMCASARLTPSGPGHHTQKFVWSFAVPLGGCNPAILEDLFFSFVYPFT